MTTKLTKEETVKDTVDWKHAQVRRDCLMEAVKAVGDDYNEIILLANQMYRFVIGETIEPIKPIETPETAKEEWK